MDDLLLGDATDQLAALRAGRVSARALLQAAVARTDRLDSVINAVVARDVDRAMADALAVDEARARGAPLGALTGLPMTVKDIFDVEGLPASMGMKSLLGRSAHDAEAVTRVRAAGAVVWGQTNVPAGSSDLQTYNRLYGVTRNPWDPSRTPGGSSGGSAAALAAGLTALEIGADIGGSLRIPASFCGVACHRPSWGLIPQRGMPAPPGFLADYDLMVVGPMARSVRDLQLLMGVLAGTPLAPTPSPRGLRVGLWLDEPSFPLDPAVRTVIEAFAVRLGGEGAAVQHIGAPLPVRPMLEAYMTLLAALLGAFLNPLARGGFDLFRGPAKIAKAMGVGPLSWASGVLGYTARHYEWLSANEARARMKIEIAAAFESNDVIIAPVAPTAAPAHNNRLPPGARRIAMSDGRRFPYLEQVDWIVLAILCDLPASVIPIGCTAGGLPVGLQVIGPPRGDAATLATAACLEGLSGGYRAPPGLDALVARG
jgi:amidase